MKLRVALAGAGNVTRAFLEYWRQHDHGIDLHIVGVLRRRGVWCGDEPASINLDGLEYVQKEDPLEKAQLLIEALPSVYPHGEPATSILRTALGRGVDVLTVDKGPLVAAYTELADLANRTRARLRFCVGGALPAIDVARRDLRGTTIRRIRAILNGTTNFVLCEIHRTGCTMQEALNVAIKNGIAEPDPSQDLSGIDTAAKMVILVNASLGKSIRLDEVQIRGIEKIDASVARSAKAVWKLVGTYENGAVRVEPELIPDDDLFSKINGTDKIAEFDSVEMGRICIAGGASGRLQMGATMTKEILNLYLPN
jgi:homoserine dehydrogenase